MAIKMVREPSATPNINNIDDIVPMRYAYGNQDGYVISKGTEAAATVNGSSFTIGSGRIVVQGVECDIDANGITIVVDNIATKKYFSVYLKVNLGTNTVNIQSEDDTAAYPDIQRGDDLTHTSTGIANLLLYTFEAQNGVISNVQKRIQAIEYSGTALADYDISKGTVEERLTKLGFSEDDIIDLDGNVVGHIKRQGNFVIGTLNSSFNQNRFGLLPEKYRPKTSQTFGAFSKFYLTLSGNTGGTFINNYETGGYSARYTISSSGTITLSYESKSVTARYTSSYYIIALTYPTSISGCSFGYEANPL